MIDFLVIGDAGDDVNFVEFDLDLDWTLDGDNEGVFVQGLGTFDVYRFGDVLQNEFTAFVAVQSDLDVIISDFP